MSESEITEVVEQEAKHEHSPRKRIRHRKKQVYDNILKQMEFYFSDANLTKDRFLGDLVKKDPYVPIEIFLKFNKVRSLTQDVNDIVKAMKNSTLLDLSEDKLKVIFSLINKPCLSVITGPSFMALIFILITFHFTLTIGILYLDVYSLCKIIAIKL